MTAPRGLFVTGTDTGVGKTRVAAALAAWCRLQGVDVGVMKPVATGARRVKGQLVSDDAQQLRDAAGTRDPLSWITPVCLAEPLAPCAAAARERHPISWPRLLAACRRMQACHRVLIVEGIGGWLVPITPRRTVSDLARALGLPVLVVARLRLGTMNHTALTVDRIRADGLTVAGVVLNAADAARTAGDRLAERSAIEWLPRLLPSPVLGLLPHAPRAGSRDAQAAWLARAIDARFLDGFRPLQPGSTASRGSAASLASPAAKRP